MVFLQRMQCLNLMKTGVTLFDLKRRLWNVCKRSTKYTWKIVPCCFVRIHTTLSIMPSNIFWLNRNVHLWTNSGVLHNYLHNLLFVNWSWLLVTYCSHNVKHQSINQSINQSIYIYIYNRIVNIHYHSMTDWEKCVFYNKSKIRFFKIISAIFMTRISLHRL